MLFNSYEFIFIFLPITLCFYYLFIKLDKDILAKWWLLFTSITFYGYWNPKYITLILLSIGINYFITYSLAYKKINKKLYFRLGLLFNIGLLSYYKYMDFFIETINDVAGLHFNLLHIILPLGISFFTLQQIAYMVDSYEGIVKGKSFINYALFVSFFPQLIAGPIVHYKKIIPQFEDSSNKKFINNLFSKGLYIFSIGLAKKVLIADTLARFASPLIDGHDPLTFFEAWGASLSYSFQLYFDFSGYSDMAIGLGLLFNVHIPKNFNSPFKARNIIDFWNRWHITLTEFITSYIFTPLVRLMPKMSFFYMMLSMFITMVIAGLWHGAAWTFVVYGVMHGFAIVTNHNLKKRKIKFPYFISWFLSFNFINICFLIFRAHSFMDVLKVLKGMLGLTGFSFPKGIISKEVLKNLGIELSSYMNNEENLILFILIVSFIAIFKLKNSTELGDEFKPTMSKAIFAGSIFTLSIMSLNKLSEFIYFNF